MVSLDPMLIFLLRKKQKEFELGLPPGGWAGIYFREYSDLISNFRLIWGGSKWVLENLDLAPLDKTVFADDDFLPPATIDIQPFQRFNKTSQRCLEKKGKPTIVSSSYLQRLKEAKEECHIKEANKVERAKRKLSLKGKKNVMK
ncbi:hypothetical protein QE152_g19528 [Popillia japonica]|uniref:Uncharacterized protein n=1 Tax=Popillia japonica TaxID=7064 RepID=A0AAW1KNU2_POPJA